MVACPFGVARKTSALPKGFRPLCRPPAGTLKMRSAKDLYRVGATGLEPVTPSVSISESFWPKTPEKVSPPTCYGEQRSFASTVEHLRVIASKHRILRSP